MRRRAAASAGSARSAMAAMSGCSCILCLPLTRKRRSAWDWSMRRYGGGPPARRRIIRASRLNKRRSYRWVKGGDRAKAVLRDAAMITVVDDREGDIYEKWARLPDDHVHLLTRACRDRNVVGGARLFAALESLAEAHRYRLELPARAGKRSARTACLAVRFGSIRIRRPKNCSDAAAPAEIALSAIEVRELDAPAGEEPVLWRLLTTHPVESIAQALQVIGWYRLRWNIEQLFRTLKRQGLGIEQSVIDGRRRSRKARRHRFDRRHHNDAAGAGTRRRGSSPAPNPTAPAQPMTHRHLRCRPPAASSTRNKSGSSMPCKTNCRVARKNSKTPIRSIVSLGPTWTIARLGGWTGYDSDKSTGPITMRDELQRFNAIVDGYRIGSRCVPKLARLRGRVGEGARATAAAAAAMWCGQEKPGSPKRSPRKRERSRRPSAMNPAARDP